VVIPLPGTPVPITGQTFVPDLSGDTVLDRVRTALQPYFV
jgi:hypothetical protein